MSNEVYCNDLLMMETKQGVDYTRCFHCGKMFVETYENNELHLFCSPECEKADDEYWTKIIAESDL